MPFSFIHFRDVVVQFSQRVPQILQERADVLTVTGPCFRCKQHGHVANDCTQQPTCYRCNKLGHISTKCRVRDVYCNVCKSARHVTEACRRGTATKTTAATAGSANVTQEEVTSAEVFNVSQKMTGSLLRQRRSPPLLQVVIISVHRLKFWWTRVICCRLVCV